ncbi:MAG TPA: hypothetical protein VLJ76_08135 [Gaiellaceae bacterium]|nr:hypothetical protein [Gaiellaceae bacterium]
MDPAPLRSGPRTWRARIGVGLSASALAFAVASLFGSHGRACPTPEGSATLDLTPLLLFAIATAAVVFDVGAVRRGDGRWGRIGLAIVGLAALVGIWGAVEGFFRAGCG